MIKPGVSLCPLCGHASDKPFYHNSTENIGAWLMESQDHYPFLRIAPGGAICHLEDPEVLRVGDGWPDEIVVSRESGNGRLKMWRSCPHCYFENSKSTYFHSSQGKIPLFVVAVIGPPSSGKTSWLGALSSRALKALEQMKYPYKLTPVKSHTAMEIIGQTGEMSNGNSNYIEIRERGGNGDVVAEVLLLDTAGENYKQFEIKDIYTANARKDSPLSRLVHGSDNGLNPGIDGAILISPAVYDRDNDPGADNPPTVESICDGMRDKLSRIPVAYVNTFSDLLMRQELSNRDKTHAPLLTEYTFPNTVMGDSRRLARYFEPKLLAERIFIQDQIAMSMPNNYAVCAARVKKGFMVQSCKKVTVEGWNKNDYDQQFNVADPLIWMLNQLKLYPLTLERGDYE